MIAPPSDRRFPPRQRGVVLVVSLVFLLVLTLIGVTALRTTTLQVRMAGNLQQSTLAFQDAEARISALVRTLNAGTVHLSENDSCAGDGEALDPQTNPDTFNTGVITTHRTCPEFLGSSGPGRLTDTAEGGRTRLIHFRIESRSATAGNARVTLQQGVYQRGPDTFPTILQE